ncbi:MAG: PepSY domain-containing protein [Ruminococcaceae bacterium]|nr:PepSY domain-containing protein [Oscillospiraceae bacterium]
MGSIDVEEGMRKAIEHATPDVLSEIKNRCNISDEKNNAVVFIPSKKKSKASTYIKFAATIAAVFMLVLLSSTMFGGKQKALAADAVIYIETVPGVRLEIDPEDNVVKAIAENAEAEALIKDMELEGKPMNIAVEEILAKMKKEKYLSEKENSLLATVKAGDEERTEALKLSLKEYIEQSSKALGIDTSLILQGKIEDIIKAEGESAAPVTPKPEASLGTTGRLELLEKLKGKLPGISPDDLKNFSITEITALLEKNNVNLDGAEKVGSVSREFVLGEGGAAARAFVHAGLGEDNKSPELKAEFSIFGGKLAYKVDFSKDGLEYKYIIDAETGDVLGWMTTGEKNIVDAGVGDPAKLAEDVAGAIQGIVGSSIETAQGIVDKYFTTDKTEISQNASEFFGWAMGMLRDLIGRISR